MELKYLRIYRMIGNFATSLVGAFIPLIIYQYTGNLIYSFLYIVLQRLMTVVFIKLCRKFIYSKPQIMLIIRIAPILVFEIMTMFIDYSPILISAIIGMAYAFDVCCRQLPCEVIFSYNNLDDSAKSMGISLTFEQIGDVSAMILGALFLDKLPIIYLIVISLSLYVISIIPLTMFYVKNKNNKTFNKEYVSNALESARAHKKNSIEKLSNSVVKKYGFQHMFYQGSDTFYLILPLVVYLYYGKFIYASIMTAVYDIVLLAVSPIIGWLDEKYDLSKVNCIACAISGVGMIAFCVIASNTNLFILQCVLTGIISATCGFPFIITESRMLVKTRVLGNSNKGLETIFCSAAASDAVYQSLGFLFPPFVPMIAGGVGLALFSIVNPYIEEKTRKDMVDFIQQNNNYDELN